MSQTITPCKECGCICRYCNDHGGLHLHVEIENLKQRLLERENHIVKMETNFLKEAEKFPNGEVAAISEELLTWQDKYSRLYEAHKRVQKVNQNLEDKLLRIVDKCETEKSALTTEVANLTRRLVDEKFNVSRLQDENERYRNDVNLAIQLLQCKPSNFVSQKYESLPGDLQLKVRTYLSSKRKQSDGNGTAPTKPEVKTIKVPIPTYPPTAMVYSVNKTTIDKDLEDKNSNPNNGVDIVSAAIMAKVLEEREKERSQMKHCETCTCQSGGSKACRNQSTQTHDQTGKTSVKSNNNRVAFSNVLSVKNSRSNGKQDKKEWVCDIETGKCGDVTEAILVDLSSPVDSPVSSANSEMSTLSWASKSDSLAAPTNENTEINSWSNKHDHHSPVGSSETLWNNKEISSSPVNNSDNSWAKSDGLHTPTAVNNIQIDNISWNGGKSVNSTGTCTDSPPWNGKSENHISATLNNNADNSAWNNKLEVQPLTNAQQEPTNPLVQDLISFDKQTNTNSKGPRHCSVRVQLGTNNILLDNVVHPFTPVLYRGRSDLSGGHYDAPRGRFDSRSSRYDPSVHNSTPRSTSTSSSSSSDAEPPPTHRKTAFRTETEI